MHDSLRAAIGHFQQAIEVEPEWAEPYAKLARAYGWLAALGGVDLQAEFYPKAKAAALRALMLDETVADAHIALGKVLLGHEWDWTAAEQSLQRSLELDPNQSGGEYGGFLRITGRYEEAIRAALMVGGYPALHAIEDGRDLALGARCVIGAG